LLAKVVNKVLEKLKIGTEVIANEAHSNDFYKEIKIKHLADISSKANKQLAAFKGFTIRNFAEYRYEEEMTIESRYYKELLEQRVEQINCVVNDHLVYLAEDPKSHKDIISKLQYLSIQ